MYLAYGLTQTSRLAFGRETAQFKQLIAIMAIVSIVLWSIVLITILVRMWLCHVWYRHRYRATHNAPPIA